LAQINSFDYISSWQPVEPWIFVFSYLFGLKSLYIFGYESFICFSCCNSPSGFQLSFLSAICKYLWMIRVLILM
jgi:hypothetical protein